jgi:lipopolysaccharide/colanic/teichoic acid biosynthesis glycosyltransferase
MVAPEATDVVGPRLHVRPVAGLPLVHVEELRFNGPGTGRSDLSWEDSVRLDLYYVDNWGLAGDLVIVLRR